MNIDLDVDPKKLARVLAWTAAGFSAAYAASRVLVFRFGFAHERRLPAFFDLGAEGNLPALFGGGLLLLAGALLAVVARGEAARGRAAGAWRWLSGIFVFLALDEWLAIHEGLIKPVRFLLQTDGLFRFAWVIPYGLLAGIVGLSCLGLLRRLPPRTRNLFLASGAIYVAGALGCEMIGGLIEQRFGRRGPEFALEVLVEESLEMGGAVLFVYALAAYIRDELSGLSVRLRFGP